MSSLASEAQTYLRIWRVQREELTNDNSAAAYIRRLKPHHRRCFDRPHSVINIISTRIAPRAAPLFDLQQHVRLLWLILPFSWRIMVLAILEENVIQPLGPSAKDDQSQWPEFTLKNVKVTSPTGTLVSLLSAHDNAPLRVEGTLDTVDRDYAHLGTIPMLFSRSTTDGRLISQAGCVPEAAHNPQHRHDILVLSIRRWQPRFLGSWERWMVRDWICDTNL